VNQFTLVKFSARLVARPQDLPFQAIRSRCFQYQRRERGLNIAALASNLYDAAYGLYSGSSERRKRWQRVCDRSARTGPEAYRGPSLPMVWPNIHAAYDRRIEPEVLLHGSPATILDRGAALDNKGDRGGPTLGRLFEGVSRERARCLRGIPLLVVGASP
jgi:hypothetical protein